VITLTPGSDGSLPAMARRRGRAMGQERGTDTFMAHRRWTTAVAAATPRDRAHLRSMHYTF